jgi:hypothetical protein
MSTNSRLRSVQKSLKGREIALLWLKTSQSRGGYLEYWERGEFHTWVSENEEAALLYYLVVEVNGGVISTVDNWRALTSWAGLLGISVIDANRQSIPVQFETVQDFSDRWGKKLRTLHADVFALEQAVELISEGYFDRHEVLFRDAREQLTSARESVELLIAGYNCFAEDNGKESISLDSDDVRPSRSVEQHLNEWVMLARTRALAAQGRVFEARNEVLRWLTLEKP